MRPDRGPDCDRCNDDGLVLLTDEKDMGHAICQCPTGERLYRVLRAIARGEPVMLEHALDHPKAYGSVRSGRGTPLAHRIIPTEES